MFRLKLLLALAITAAFSVVATASETTIQKAMLGVAIAPVTSDVPALSTPSHFIEGAQVVAVTRGSPGERAGLRVGDVVVTMNGEAVKNMMDLQQRVSRARLGDSFRLIVRRDSEELVLDGVFDEWTPECRGKRLKDTPSR